VDIQDTKLGFFGLKGLCFTNIYVYV